MVARKSPAAAKQAGEAATERWWHSRRRVAPIAAALLLGVALAVTGWFVTARLWEDRLTATQFGMVAENRVLAVDTAFETQVKLVDDLRGYFGSRGAIPRRDEFTSVAAYLAEGEKHPISVTWVAHVRDQDRAAFENQMRIDQPGFAIQDRGSDGAIVVAARRPDYYPVLFAGGLNGSTPGLDLGTDGVLLDTVRHASAQARTTATPARPGGSDGGRVISIVAPLFQRGAASNGVSGFILGTFDLGAVVGTVPHSVVTFHGVDSYLFDPADVADAAPLFVRSSVLNVKPPSMRSRAELESGPHWTGEVRIADTQLMMIVVPVAGGPLDPWHPRAWIILLVLMLCTVAVAAALGKSVYHAHAQEGVLIGMRRRDAVLQGVAASGAELVGTLDFRQATAATLALIGRATGVDRVHMVRRALPVDAVTPWNQQLWSATQEAAPDSVSGSDGDQLGDDVLQPILHRQMQGGVIVVNAKQETGTLRTALDRSKIRSMVVVPALLTKGAQCLIAFVHCATEPHWSPAEHALLKVVADLLGGALARHLANEQLADANRILENSPTMLFRATAAPGWPLTYVSENVSRYGYSATELCATGRKFEEFIHPNDLPGVRADLARAIDAGRNAAEFVSRERPADGRYRWFETKITIHRDLADRVMSISGIMLDVTERKQAEDALAFSHVLLTAALENSPDGILITDEHDRAIVSNQHFTELWKIPQALIATGSDERAIAAAAALLKDPEGFVTRIGYLHSHRDQRTEDELEFKDGRIIERPTAPLFNPDGRYLGRIWFFRNITERKLAQKTLTFSNTLLTAAMESSPDGLLVVDTQSKIISFNKRFLEVMQISPELAAAGRDEIVLAHLAGLAKNPDQYLDRVRYLYAHSEEEGLDEIEFIDGRLIERQSASLYDSGHQYLGRIWLFRDITERKRAQLTLASSNNLLTAAMNSSRDGMLVVDPQARIISFNDRFVELMKVPPQLVSAGQSEPVLAYVTAHVKDPEQFLERVRQIYEDPDERACDQFELKDGRFIERRTAPLYDNRHQYLGLICFFRDVTDPPHADQAHLAAFSGPDALADRLTKSPVANEARQALRKRVKPPTNAA